MIGWLLGTRIGRLLSAVVVALGGVLTYGAVKERKGAQGERHKATERRLEKHKEGRNAVADEKEEIAGLSNSDVVDRMRSRDSDWRGM